MATDADGIYDTTLNALGLLVTGGQVPPGKPLPIGKLDTSASRTVIREAVRALEGMGLVRSRRRVGVVVKPPEEWNVYDPRLIRWRLDSPKRAARAAHLRALTELRMGVEPIAAGLAAERATPAECGVLTGAVMDMAVHGRAEADDAYLEADILFHTTLLAATRNEMLAALHHVVTEVLRGRTRHGLMPNDTPNPEAIRLHAEVAQAVQASDRIAAEKAMRAIVEEAGQAMLDKLERQKYSVTEGGQEQ